MAARGDIISGAQHDDRDVLTEPMKPIIIRRCACSDRTALSPTTKRKPISAEYRVREEKHA